MARRQQLNETQVAELFEPPTAQHELLRHYTLCEPDLAAIRRCRGDHNRLGYALMLCHLRFPGRALRAGERPPPALLAFVSAQVEVLPDASTNISRRNGTGSGMQLSARSSSGFVLSVGAPPLS